MVSFNPSRSCLGLCLLGALPLQDGHAQHGVIREYAALAPKPEAVALGSLEPVMANSQNLFVGNAALFRAAGLEPLPAEAITPGPLMLLPRAANPAAQPPEARP